ncbi:MULTISPECIES: class I SAM-dependent methyltransferase [Bradyrhizobium]|uniref:class I SAM-dependent methyltransferase n=1 Tax=Bradyrhizobium centrosematis TaxID=1300039 RepID=UPI0021692133|nr:class I SAM-dependent methyltransferase [Bradyrhizobium centrosematis]MCS3764779.1 ubiquinone/menaquinone biosynthesis C-methylase UbiE [Bradyrhizobium centrosematis]MCS3776169.1 ubiquinone/menaquinone biosynthesis C-methylase UbiE [Bradyrhizobium centrosematis]
MSTESTTTSQAASGRIHRPWDDFDGLGHFYQFRPEYPPRIAEQLRSVLRGTTGGRIIEVGAGTGLFTRSLATVFGSSFQIFALEPNEHMRRHAESQTPTGMLVDYADGVAENLQAVDGSAQLVTAASAVHRFNRPAFYREAQRVLAPGGLLAIVQYEPYDRDSAFADGFLSVIEAALPNYHRRRHSRPEGGYSEIDISAELRAESGLKDIRRDAFVFTELIDRERFEHRARSFTIVQKAINNRGEEALLSALRVVFEQHRDSNAFVEMPYEAEIITARRT